MLHRANKELSYYDPAMYAMVLEICCWLCSYYQPETIITILLVDLVCTSSGHAIKPLSHR